MFKISKEFPKTETYSLTDQIRRSSRSVSGNIAEAFRKRRYPKHFISKLTDSEGEAAETQVWLDFALSCGYLSITDHKHLNHSYNSIIGMLISMENTADNWCFTAKK